jgi:hypothetical protein
MQRPDDLKKSVFFAGVILLCLGVAVNMLLFLVSLPGGPGTQQPFDWVLILTSVAPAYLPWKVPIILYVLAVILIIAGWLLSPKNSD